MRPALGAPRGRGVAKEGRKHDSQTQERAVSPVLDEEESEDRKTPQPGHVRLAPGGGEARAGGSVLQEALSAWRVAERREGPPQGDPSFNSEASPTPRSCRSPGVRGQSGRGSPS